MKSVFLNRLLKKISKKKWLFGLSIFLFGGLFGYIGWEQGQKVGSTGDDQVTSVDITQSEEYQAAIQSYDASIASTQKTIEIINQQVTIQQQYCDNSPYMQMDSDNYYLASAIYVLQLVENDTAKVKLYGEESIDNSGKIMAVVAQYMNANHLSTVFQKQMPEINVDYLSEILNCSISGNYVNISVSYKEEEAAIAIRNIVEQDLKKHIFEQIDQYSGEYTFDLIDDTVITKGDISVLNTQNNNLNNLRSYRINLADQQKKVADLQAAKQQYMASAVAATESVDESDQSVENPRIVMVRYGGMGVMIGLLLPLAVWVFMLVADDKIKDIQDVNHFGIFTFGSLQDGSARENLIVFLEKRNIKNIFFSILTDSFTETEKKNIDELLAGRQINSVSGYLDRQPEVALKQFVSADGCILVIALEKTSAGQIQEQLELCRRMDIPVFGCIQL